jgi:hypothetical protein
VIETLGTGGDALGADGEADLAAIGF